MRGGDSNGGKLISFGYVSFDKPGHQDYKKYRHTYIPLVFSRVKEENEESALLMVAALVGKTILLLFGMTLDIKGGLISDHVQSVVLLTSSTSCLELVARLVPPPQE